MRKLNVAKKLERILKINEHYDNVQYRLQKAKSGLCSNNPDQFEEELKQCLLEAERGYYDIRRFAGSTISSTTYHKKLDIEEAEICNIEITKLENGIIKISMPIILPFHYTKKIVSLFDKKGKEYVLDKVVKADIMVDMVRRAVEKYVGEHPEDRNSMDCCTLMYLNVYERGFYQDRIPDTDNYSYKIITDIVSSTFCFGDDFSEVDFFLKTEIGDVTHTELYLIPMQFWFNPYRCLMMRDKASSYQKPEFPKLKNSA